MHRVVKTTGGILILIGLAFWGFVIGLTLAVYAFMRWWS